MNKRILAVGVVLAFALVLAGSPALAAVDMFIKIGDIKGESKDGAHRDEIDILAWSWGMSRDASSAMGAARRGGRVDVQDLSFTKYVDKSSPKLMQACSSGTHIPEARLVVRKAGSRPLEYLVIELQDVMVSSVSTGGAGGEDRLTENVTLNFAQVKVVYTEQAPDGSAKGSVEYSWNIEANKAEGRPMSKAPTRRRP